MIKAVGALTAAAFILFANGCAQEEDLSDINEAWISANDELARDLESTRESHQALSQRFDTLQEAELDDPEQITLRNEIETTLQDHQDTLDEVQQMVLNSSELRNQVLEGGRRGSFESAWSEAQTDYAAARAKLDELRAQHDTLGDDLEELESAATPAETETE